MSKFFEQLAEIKHVLSSSEPAQQKFARIEPLLQDRDLEREFWNLLDDETWLPTLISAGIFNEPPPPETADGRTQYPYWGASKYLARVASRAPAEVASVFAAIDTENVSVIGDLLDAAIKLPVEQAAKLVPAVRRVAAAGALWVHFKHATQLCVRLAEEGKVELSLSLAEALFAPRNEAAQATSRRSDDYWSKQGLRTVAPLLSRLRPREFLPMLCDWLEESVRSTKNVADDSNDDYSYLWRPAIEEHEQNHDNDLTASMVGAVREGFDSALTSNALSLVDALALLERRPLMIFRRLYLHLVTEFGDQEPELLRRTILSRDLFDDYRLKHEYARLVGRRLPGLDEGDQDEWYRWVDQGPDMADFDDEVRQNLHREPTDTDRLSRIEYWQFQRLHWLRDALDGERRLFYERMLAQHGAPQLADLNIRTSVGRWGETSPATVEQFSEGSFEAAVEQVSSWKPTDALGPTLGGMVSTFGDYVSQKPEEFSRKARALKGREPALVATYLRQMSAAIKAGREVDLPAVLDLCNWVVGNSLDGGWQGTRDEISELIEVACQAMRDNRPRFSLDEFRKPLWNLVWTLSGDRSKSYIVRDTADDDLRTHDYLDLGMNSPRGKAVEAGIEFARWVALHLTAGDPAANSVVGGMTAVPELRELLERSIDPDSRSLESMAIIGSRVGVINWIDAQWLQQNAGRLFELEKVEDNPAQAFGWAAWNAFLTWVRPHIVFYRAFESQFAYAVRQAALVAVDRQDHDQPMFKLGEHLMILYGRGQLSLDSSVLKAFLGTAQPAIRRHALGFVGSSLGGESIPSEIIERFMALWEEYWSGNGRTDAAQQPDAVLFGSWFASGEFPDSWALSTLHDYAEVVAVPEPEHLVMERLAQIANTDIVKSVRIVERMVKGDREGWRMHGWLEPAKTILEEAVKTGTGPRAAAEQVIDYLGRRGYVAFGSLLAT